MASLTSVVDDDDRDDHLTQLGVTTTELSDSALLAYQAASTCTANHPRNYAGTRAYAEMVGFLRDFKLKQGWEKDSDSNYETVVHPDRLCQIAVAAGNADTGRRNATPRTRTPKGAATKKVVTRNGQMTLFGQHPSLADIAEGRTPPTYLLLHHLDIDAHEIRIELSIPTDMSGKAITKWSRRILLDPIPFDAQVSLDDFDEDDEIDIDIDPKGR